MSKILPLFILVSISSCNNSTNKISLSSNNKIKESSVDIAENEINVKKATESIDLKDVQKKNNPRYPGYWFWRNNDGNWGFGIEIHHKNDSIYGIFEAYAQGGNKIDQGREITQKYNIIGIVRNNIAYLNFSSAWSDAGELGTATLEKKSDSILEWKITKYPKTSYGEFWIVKNCILKQK
jgi:hypothetical protein